MGEHTALPWRAKYDVIVSDTPCGEFQTTAVAYYGDEMRHAAGLPFGKERDANAAFIVKSVNSHEALVSAISQIETLAVCVGVVDPAQHRNMLENIARIAREAQVKP